MMTTDDKSRLLELLDKSFSGYGKPMPDASMIKAWVQWLAPFSIRVMTQAFAEYCNEEPTFPPTPIAIANRCKALDGRPDGDEAWSLALACRDEAATVVWTSEMAEAFGICKTVLDSGDKIGARKSFLVAYERLVLAARIRNLPARWTVSIGWDKQAAALAVDKAVRAGYIALESVDPVLLLAGPALDQDAEDQQARANMKRIKEMVAGMVPASEKMRRANERRAEQEREALALAKQDSGARVNLYIAGQERAA